MKMLRAIAMAATVLGAAGPPPAGAQPVRPWCEYGAMGGSAPDCSYATFAQCLRTARGDGTCVRNPAFDWPYFRSHGSAGALAAIWPSDKRCGGI